MSFHHHMCLKVPDNTASYNYEQRLIQCCQERCSKCVEILLSKGTGMNTVYKAAALAVAAEQGDPECMRVLLKAGADLRSANGRESALAFAVSEWNSHRSLGDLTQEHTECVEILLEATGVDVSPRPKGMETTLISVASYGDVERLKALIGAGAHIHARDWMGKTALAKAASNGHKECIQELFNAGASVNVVDKLGWTPLKQAMCHIFDDCTQFLIEAGAATKDSKDVSFLNVICRNVGSTPLTKERRGKMYGTIQQVLKSGAYVNVNNSLQDLFRIGCQVRWQIPMLLLAAGEKIADEKKAEIQERNHYNKDLTLRCLSIEAVRKYMINANPNNNLFCAVEELEIPEALKSFLVYDVCLDQEYNPEVDETGDESDDDVWVGAVGMMLQQAAANMNAANMNAANMIAANMNAANMNAANMNAANVSADNDVDTDWDEEDEYEMYEDSESDTWEDVVPMLHQQAAARGVEVYTDSSDEVVANKADDYAESSGDEEDYGAYEDPDSDEDCEAYEDSDSDVTIYEPALQMRHANDADTEKDEAALQQLEAAEADADDASYDGGDEDDDCNEDEEML